MRKRKTRFLSLLLAVLLLMLSALPAKAVTATTIHLAKTTGTVSVTNASRRSVSTWANMLLYSGYSVHSRVGSYAWLSLDSSKLAKLDAASIVELRKSGSKLELLLRAGHLYFNVSSPLTSSETMNIRTSTMAVGIRGTCGWVKEIDEYTSELYLLEGTVQISSADPTTGRAKTATVKAGEKAVATVRPEGTEITQEKFTVDDIDEYVMEELVEDPELCRDIYADSGLVINEEYITADDPAEEAIAQYRTVIGQADTYDFGDSLDGTISYQYALVQMQPEDAMPTLLLSKNGDGELSELSYIRVFQYHSESGTMYQPTQPNDSPLFIGIEGVWAYGLAMSGDGNGLYYSSWSRADGEEYFWRLWVDGNSLTGTQIWDGTFGVNEPASEVIDWHDISDTSALDSWTS